MPSLHDEISKVAHELFEKSGRVAGRDIENWLEAEKIVKARHSHGNGGNGKEKEAKPKKSAARKTAPQKSRTRKSEE